jgi:hypothetical protein
MSKSVKMNPYQTNASVELGDEITFFEVKAMRRWVWHGCRWASGFATETDAREAFKLLGDADPDRNLTVGKVNREISQRVQELTSRGWGE